MGRNPMDRPVEVPKWDPALEGLVNEEYARLGRPLTVADFRRLGRAHKIRFHDIMATMCQLDRHGRWTHDAGPGNENALADLYAHGRVDEDIAERHSVTWAPQRP